MQLIQKTVQANLNIFLFGDEHRGSVLCYQKGLDKLFDMLESPWGGLTAKHNYGWHSGDHIEAITVDDPRYHPDTCKEPIPLKQNDDWVKAWRPIRHKLVGMNDGNHPWRLYRFGNLAERACRDLGINYGGWMAKVSWLDNKGRLIFKSFHTHGNRGIWSVSPDPVRRKAQKLHILRRQLQDMAGDVLLESKGHTHQILIGKPEPEVYLVDDGQSIRQVYTNRECLNVHFPLQIGVKESKAEEMTGYIHPDYRWYVNTGSFLKSMTEGITSYAEASEYSPVELGFAIAEIRDRQIVDIKKVVL
jgi:hypothetical protein